MSSKYRHLATIGSKVYFQKKYTIPPIPQLNIPSAPVPVNIPVLRANPPPESVRVNLPPNRPIVPEKKKEKKKNADTSEKKYECQFEGCGKKFKRKKNLNCHKRIHTDDAYVCGDCGKLFARKGNFEQHKLIHLTQRPFKCKYCPKGFNQKHCLVTHTRYEILLNVYDE